MLNIKLVKDFEKTKEIAKELAPCGAIECEYGDNVITENFEGVQIAMYHHGKYSDNTPPSERWDVYDKLEKGLDNFIISHVDLDTIMGIMWASKILKPTSIAKEIGRLASIQDLKGFHYIENEILKNLRPVIKYRFLGVGYIVSNIEIEKTNELVLDVSKPIHKAILKIKDIIVEGVDEGLKNQINRWLKEKEADALKHQILFDEENSIRIFNADKNLLSAYNLNNKTSKINIQYNSGNGSITIATYNEEIAKELFGENGVITPLREVFGDEAGGRISVGGAPRNKKYNFEDALKLYNHIKRKLNQPKKLISHQIL